MDVVLVANPRAGASSNDAADELADALGALGQVSRVDPTGGGDEAIRGAAEAGALVVVAGGDGTVNSTVNALADRLDRVTFAIAPLGTANDLASALGLPDEPTELVDALADGREREVDVARVEGGGVSRLFVNSALGGFPATVGEEVDDELKSRFGSAAFWIGGLKAAKRLDRFTAVVEETTVPDCVAVLVGNGRSASGFAVWPDGEPDDGLLDACALAPSNAAAAAALVPLIKAGKHAGREGVFLSRGRRLELSTEPAIELSVDGEFVGLRTPATVEIAGRMKIRAPAS